MPRSEAFVPQPGQRVRVLEYAVDPTNGMPTCFVDEPLGSTVEVLSVVNGWQKYGFVVIDTKGHRRTACRCELAIDTPREFKVGDRVSGEWVGKTCERITGKILEFNSLSDALGVYGVEIQFEKTEGKSWFVTCTLDPDSLRHEPAGEAQPAAPTGPTEAADPYATHRTSLAASGRETFALTNANALMAAKIAQAREALNRPMRAAGRYPHWPAAWASPSWESE